MKKIIFSIVVYLFVIGGCKKDIVENPNFDVTASDSISIVAKVGKPITFNLDGNPDIVYFYSGEPGKRYKYAGRVFAIGTPQLQFTSLRANGKQEGSLQLMISSDFPGITVGGDSISKAATIKKIAAATWSDITSRVLLSTGTSTASGTIDFSEFAQKGKPIFIAFKYLALAGTIQNKWTISGLILKNTLSDGTVYTLANTTNTAITNYGVATIYSPGWVFYPITNNYSWLLSSNNLIITGAATAATALAPVEAWTIMGPVDLNKVSPDIGSFLKGLDTRLNSYSYTYSTAGTYTATFVGSENNIYGKKEVVRQINITVKP